MDNKKLEEFFNKMKDGDTLGVELLYTTYYRNIFGIAFSFTKDKDKSDDVVQNVFYKLLRLSKEAFPKSNYFCWLYVVVKNESIKYLKEENKLAPVDSLGEIGFPDKDIEEYVDMDEFYSLIKHLDNERREIVSLKILGNYTFKEISKMLNKPIGTIQWLYNTSIKKLRIILSSLLTGLIVAICAILGEGIVYIQNISIKLDSTDGKTNFYVDYILMGFFGVFIIILVAFIIFFIKSEKIPTKIHK